MTKYIRDITSEELQLFGKIAARLERLGPGEDGRSSVLGDVLRLVRGDFAASYIWNPSRRRFTKPLNCNIDPINFQRYEDWFQFRDPLAPKLRARRRATIVEEVISRKTLERTEFYNDFLMCDGLHHGIDIYIFDGDQDLGDIRIWRRRHRPDFGAREKALLDALAPFFQRVLRRCVAEEHLTAREKDVVALVARGCRDLEIARILNISFSTVRTHLSRAMEKTGCANRAELAANLATTVSPDRVYKLQLQQPSMSAFHGFASFPPESSAREKRKVRAAQ